MPTWARPFAVGAGIAWAIPWAGVLGGQLAGGADPRPVAWHESHALAGALFTLTLASFGLTWLAHVRRIARIALAAAVAGAVSFFVANAGEALTGAEGFVPLYGVGLLGMCGGLLAFAIGARRELAPPLPLLCALLASFPLAVPFALVPPLGYALLVAYGGAWMAFGLFSPGASDDPGRM
jgi:hypothetical protein